MSDNMSGPVFCEIELVIKQRWNDKYDNMFDLTWFGRAPSSAPVTRSDEERSRGDMQGSW
jgi:hypothetical protein